MSHLKEITKMANIFKAFADPTRLRLIRLLASNMEEKLCVVDLAKKLGISQPAASQHIKVLKNINILYGLAFETIIKEIIINDQITNFPIKTVDNIGSWWSRQLAEVDILVVNKEKKQLFIGECKLNSKQVTYRLGVNLKKKGELIKWRVKARNNFFGIFTIGKIDNKLKDKLNKIGINATLDQLGENTSSLEEANKVGVEPNGDINYILFKYCKYYIKPSYNNYKMFMGEIYDAMKCIVKECPTPRAFRNEFRESAEWIRIKLLTPHEEKAIKRNGDV